MSVLWPSKYAKNAFSARAPPRTPLGELTTLPRPLRRLERGHPSPYATPLDTDPLSALVMRPPRSPARSTPMVNCDSKKETSAHSFMQYERTITLVFRHEEWLAGGDPFYLKFWAKLTPFEQKNVDFQSLFACCKSAIIPSEKSSINSRPNISPLRAFQ